MGTGMGTRLYPLTIMYLSCFQELLYIF